MLKSKSDGEVGQSASCGAAALPQSSSNHEKHASNQVGPSLACSFAHSFVYSIHLIIFFGAGVAVGSERHVSPIGRRLQEAPGPTELR